MKAKKKEGKSKKVVKEVIGIAAFAGLYAFGAFVGWKLAQHYDNTRHGVSFLKDRLRFLTKDYLMDYNDDRRMIVFDGIRSIGEGLKPSELGELGVKILELGGSSEQTYTHFLAFGEQIS